MTNQVEVEIRPLTTLAELTEVESLEREIWGMDDLELISFHTLHAMIHSGGQILGAYAGNQLVGFVVSILGTQGKAQISAAKQLKLYSFIAGVSPDYQNQNVGYLLKLAQREFAMSIGIKHISWTYDPLESRNARFNIAKLGAICNQYHRNFHGEMSGINAGIPTDRFEVDWWIENEQVVEKIEGGKRPLSSKQPLPSQESIINSAIFNNNKLLEPSEKWQIDNRELYLVEIPADYQTLKKQDFSLAKKWRSHTCLVFEALFSCGYVVTDFLLEKDFHILRSYYVFYKNPEKRV